MQGCKKLFQRDKIFLLCLSGAVALILLLSLFQCCNVLKRDGEIFQRYREFYGAEFVDENGLVWNLAYWMTESAIIGVMRAVLAVVVTAQFIKWNVLEGKGGKEFQKLLPVKASACVTYDYVCGILFLWTPAAIMGIMVSVLAKQYELEGILDMNKVVGNIWSEVGRELVVISCIYSFLIFAKKITRYIPGILLFLLICGYMMVAAGLVFRVDFSVLWNWGFHNAGRTQEYILLLLMVPVFVLLSYLCDGKRDIAGSGFFYFKSVHFLVMLMVFVELFVIFAASMIIPFGITANIVSLILSTAVTMGVHYLTWGRKAR